MVQFRSATSADRAAACAKPPGGGLRQLARLLLEAVERAAEGGVGQRVPLACEMPNINYMMSSTLYYIIYMYMYMHTYLSTNTLYHVIYMFSYTVVYDSIVYIYGLRCFTEV